MRPSTAYSGVRDAPPSCGPGLEQAFSDLHGRREYRPVLHRARAAPRAAPKDASNSGRTERRTGDPRSHPPAVTANRFGDPYPAGKASGAPNGVQNNG